MAKVIHNPLLAAVNERGTNEAEFVIEPLHAGYGNTLGNSLRRVLLSSIKGAAIVAFRIEGATHEFTTVADVKEDVVQRPLAGGRIGVLFAKSRRTLPQRRRVGCGAGAGFRNPTCATVPHRNQRFEIVGAALIHAHQLAERV